MRNIIALWILLLTLITPLNICLAENESDPEDEYEGFVKIAPEEATALGIPTSNDQVMEKVYIRRNDRGGHDFIVSTESQQSFLFQTTGETGMKAVAASDVKIVAKPTQLNLSEGVGLGDLAAKLDLAERVVEKTDKEISKTNDIIGEKEQNIKSVAEDVAAANENVEQAEEAQKRAIAAASPTKHKIDTAKADLASAEKQNEMAMKKVEELLGNDPDKLTTNYNTLKALSEQEAKARNIALGEVSAKLTKLESDKTYDGAIKNAEREYNNALELRKKANAGGITPEARAEAIRQLAYALRTNQTDNEAMADAISALEKKPREIMDKHKRAISNLQQEHITISNDSSYDTRAEEAKKRYDDATRALQSKAAKQTIVEEQKGSLRRAQLEDAPNQMAINGANHALEDAGSVLVKRQEKEKVAKFNLGVEQAMLKSELAQRAKAKAVVEIDNIVINSVKAGRAESLKTSPPALNTRDFASEVEKADKALLQAKDKTFRLMQQDGSANAKTLNGEIQDSETELKRAAFAKGRIEAAFKSARREKPLLIAAPPTSTALVPYVNTSPNTHYKSTEEIRAETTARARADAQSAIKAENSAARARADADATKKNKAAARAARNETRSKAVALAPQHNEQTSPSRYVTPHGTSDKDARALVVPYASIGKSPNPNYKPKETSPNNKPTETSVAKLTKDKSGHKHIAGHVAAKHLAPKAPSQVVTSGSRIVSSSQIPAKPSARAKAPVVTNREGASAATVNSANELLMD